MAVLWRQLAAQPGYEDCRLLQDTALELAHSSFEVAFTAAVARAVTEGLLTPEGHSLLLAFGGGCGRYDMARQQEHIAHYRERLAQLSADLAYRGAVGARLCRVAGPAGGMALALLLL